MTQPGTRWLPLALLATTALVGACELGADGDVQNSVAGEHQTAALASGIVATDASGMIKVQVFRGDPVTASGAGFATAAVDDGWVLVAGGAQVDDDPQPQSFLVGSVPSWDLKYWVGVANNIGQASPYTLQAFAIGMQVIGMSEQQLRSALTVAVAQGAASEAHPSAQAFLPTGYIAVGGGAYAWGDTDWYGQYLTRSQPVVDASGLITSWVVASKDHVNPDPGNVLAYVIGIPSCISGVGCFDTKVFTHYYNVSWSGRPVVLDVEAVDGHVLTSVGAWADYGNGAGHLLTRMAPQSYDKNIGFADAADYLVADPAGKFNAYGVSIRAIPRLWRPGF